MEEEEEQQISKNCTQESNDWFRLHSVVHRVYRTIHVARDWGDEYERERARTTNISLLLRLHRLYMLCLSLQKIWHFFFFLNGCSNFDCTEQNSVDDKWDEWKGNDLVCRKPQSISSFPNYVWSWYANCDRCNATHVCIHTHIKNYALRVNISIGFLNRYAYNRFVLAQTLASIRARVISIKNFHDFRGGGSIELKCFLNTELTTAHVYFIFFFIPYFVCDHLRETPDDRNRSDLKVCLCLFITLAFVSNLWKFILQLSLYIGYAYLQ